VRRRTVVGRRGQRPALNSGRRTAGSETRAEQRSSDGGVRDPRRTAVVGRRGQRPAPNSDEDAGVRDPCRTAVGCNNTQ
jgi:hypothetical protein